MTERVRVEITGDSRDLVAAAVAAAGAIKGVRAEVKRSDRDVARSTRSFTSLGSVVGKVNRDFTFLRNAIRIIKWPALITGAGMAAQALSGAAAGATALVAALTPLTGALVAYPALFGAIGQGLVTFKLGLGEVGKALAGNEQALKRLSKEQRAFYDRMKELKPLFRELQSAASKGLLPGLEKGLDRALKNFDVFKQAIAETGDVIGQLAVRAGTLIGSKGFGRDLEKLGHANARTIHDLGVAGIYLGDALRHVLVAADPFVKWLTKTAAHLAHLVDQQAKAGRESGALAHFFEETRRTLEVLGPIVSNVGHALANVFTAARPAGMALLGELKEITAEWREWTGSVKGQRELRAYFMDALPTVRQFGGLLADLAKVFIHLGTQPGIDDFLRKVRHDLLPVFEEVIGKTTQAFGPALVDLLVSMTRLLGDLAGTSGPLTGLVRVITALADGLHALFEAVPGLNAAVVTAMGAATVGKFAIGLAKMLGGVKLGGVLGKAGAGGIAGKVASRLTERGASPANPLWVAVVGGGAGGPGGKGGGAADKILKGAVGAKAAQVAARAAPIAGRIVPVIGAAGLLAFIATRSNHDYDPRGSLQRAAAGRASNVGSGSLFGRRASDIRAGASAPFSKDESASAFAAGYEQLKKRLREVRAEFARMRAGAVGDVRNMQKVAAQNLRRIGDDIGFHTKRGKQAVLDNFAAAAAGIRKRMSDSKGLTNTGGREIARLLELHTKRGKDALKGNMDKVIAVIAQTMRRGGKITDQGLALIRKAYVQELRFYGLSPKQAINEAKPGTSYIGGPDEGTRGPGHARGGLVQFGKPGDKGPDRIPARMGGRNIMVGSGEVGMVANASQQEVLNQRLADFGGLRGFFQKVNKPHYMAQGGWVGVPPMGLNPAAKSIAQFAMRKYGAYATSTYRPGAITSSGNISNHARHAAVDLVSGNMLAMARGLDRAFRPRLDELIHTPLGYSIKHGQKTAPIAAADHYDHVHEAAFGRAVAALARLKRIMVSGTPSPLLSTVQGALDRTVGGAQSVLDNLSATSGDLDVSGFHGKWTAVMAQIARQRGWSLHDWRQLVAGESGGRVGVPNAQGSGAFGLGQLMPGTYATYGGGPGSSGVEQIVAMANYISDRYGDPSAALSFWLSQNPHWYERGGFIPAAAGVPPGTPGIVGPTGQVEYFAPKKKRRKKKPSSIAQFNLLEQFIEDQSALFSNDERNFRLDDILTKDELNALLGRAGQIRFAYAGELGLVRDTIVPHARKHFEAWKRRVRMMIAGVRRMIRRRKRIREEVHSIDRRLARLGKHPERNAAEIKRLKRRRAHLHNEAVAIRREMASATGQPDTEMGDGQLQGLGPRDGALGRAIALRDKFKAQLEEFEPLLRPSGSILTGAADWDYTIASLKREGATKPETTGPDASALADLMREQRDAALEALAVSRAQFDVFKGFAPLVGSFAHGTRYVPQTGLAMVHRGEQIKTDPEGPYGSQLTRGGGGGQPVQVTVIFKGEAPSYRDVDVLVDGKLQEYKREQGRKARLLTGSRRPLP
jgi:hypothetical protein